MCYPGKKDLKGFWWTDVTGFPKEIVIRCIAFATKKIKRDVTTLSFVFEQQHRENMEMD